MAETPVTGALTVSEVCAVGTTVGGDEAVVKGRDLVRRFGSGDAAVDALRGVTIDGVEITSLRDRALTQLRRVVRFESVITAVIGAVLGLALGVAFGYAAVAVLGGQGIRFALPVGQIVGMLVVAVIAGIVAAVIPARRAARLNILEAIHYE